MADAERIGRICLRLGYRYHYLFIVQPAVVLHAIGHSERARVLRLWQQARQ